MARPVCQSSSSPKGGLFLFEMFKSSHTLTSSRLDICAADIVSVGSSLSTMHITLSFVRNVPTISRRPSRHYQTSDLGTPYPASVFKSNMYNHLLKGLSMSFCLSVDGLRSTSTLWPYAASTTIFLAETPLLSTSNAS